MLNYLFKKTYASSSYNIPFMWSKRASVDETCDLRKRWACESVICPLEPPQAWVSHGASLSQHGTMTHLHITVTSHQQALNYTAQNCLNHLLLFLVIVSSVHFKMKFSHIAATCMKLDNWVGFSETYQSKDKSAVMEARYKTVKSHQSDTIWVWLPAICSGLCLLSNAPFLIFQSWWPVKSLLCSYLLAHTLW